MSERIVYDRERLEILSIQLLREDHPDWSYEKRKEEGLKPERMDYILRARMTVDLKNKLMKDDNGMGTSDYYFKRAKWVLDNVQPELLQNINEFIDGIPLSDIKIHGVSISDVMTQFEPERPISFMLAIESIICWKNAGYKNSNFCRYYFAK